MANQDEYDYYENWCSEIDSLDVSILLSMYSKLFEELKKKIPGFYVQQDQFVVMLRNGDLDEWLTEIHTIVEQRVRKLGMYEGMDINVFPKGHMEPYPNDTEHFLEYINVTLDFFEKNPGSSGSKRRWLGETSLRLRSISHAGIPERLISKFQETGTRLIEIGFEIDPQELGLTVPGT